MPAAIDSLLADARERFAGDADLKPQAELGLALRRLDDLYLRARAAGDFKTALAITKERAALLRLTEVAPTIDPPDDEPNG